MRTRLFCARFLSALLSCALCGGLPSPTASAPSACLLRPMMDKRGLEQALPAPDTGLEERAQTVPYISEVTGDIQQWVESHNESSWLTTSSRYRTVQANVRAREMARQCRFIISPTQQWASQFPEMQRLDQQIGTFKPGPGAFGQVVIAAYRFTEGPNQGRPFLVIEEVQPGDQYRRLSHSRRQHLGRWRVELIRRVIDLAEERNLLVFATTAETIRQVYSRIPQEGQLARPLDEREGTVNYTEPLSDETLWENRTFNISDHPFLPARGLRIWRAYRGNAAIAQRADALRPGTPAPGALELLFVPDEARRYLFLGQVLDRVIRPAINEGALLPLDPWVSAITQVMCWTADPSAAHSSPRLREMASWILSLIGRPTPVVIEAYQRSLAQPATLEPDPDTRIYLVDDLGALIPETVGQVDAVMGLLGQIEAANPGTELAQSAQRNRGRLAPVCAVARTLIDPASTRVQRIQAAGRIANLLSAAPDAQWGDVASWGAVLWSQHAAILQNACQEAILSESSRRGDQNLQGMLQLVNVSVDLMARQAPHIPADNAAAVAAAAPVVARFQNEWTGLRALLRDEVRRRLDARQNRPAVTIQGLDVAIARLDAITTTGLEEEFKPPQPPDHAYYSLNGYRRLPMIGGTLDAYNPAARKTEKHWKLERLPPVPIGMAGPIEVAGLTFQFAEKRPDLTEVLGKPEYAGGVAVQAPPQGRVWQIYLDGKWLDLDDIPFGVNVYIKRGYFDVRGIDLEGKVGRPVDDDTYRRVFQGFGDSGTFEYRVVMFWTDNLGVEHRVNLPRQALAKSMSRGSPERDNERPGWDMTTLTSLPSYPILGHAMINAGDYVTVHDLGSTNGITVAVRKEYKLQRGAVNLWSRVESADPGSLTLGAVHPDEISEVQLSRADRTQADGRPDQCIVFPYEGPFRVYLTLSNGSQRAAAEIHAATDGMWVRSGANDVYEFQGTTFTSPDPIPAAGQDTLGDRGSMIEGKGYRVRYDPRSNRMFVVNFSPYKITVTLLNPSDEQDTGPGDSKTQGLEELPQRTRRVVNYWTRILNDPTSDVQARGDALRTIDEAVSLFYPEDPRLTPVVMLFANVLQRDPDEGNRAAAAWTLAHTLPRREALPAIEQALLSQQREPSAQMRQDLLGALGSIRFRVEDVQRIFSIFQTVAAEDPNPDVRQRAGQELLETDLFDYAADLWRTDYVGFSESQVRFIRLAVAEAIYRRCIPTADTGLQPLSRYAWMLERALDTEQDMRIRAGLVQRLFYLQCYFNQSFMEVPYLNEAQRAEHWTRWMEAQANPEPIITVLGALLMSLEVERAAYGDRFEGVAQQLQQTLVRLQQRFHGVKVPTRFHAVVSGGIRRLGRWRASGLEEQVTVYLKIKDQLVPVSLPTAGLLFNGLTSSQANGKVIIAQDIFPIKVVSDVLQEGQDRMIVPLAKQDAGGRVFLRPGIQLSDNVRKILRDRIVPLPGNVAEVRAKLARLNAGPGDVVLLDETTTNEERIWVPQETQTPVINIRALDAVELNAQQLAAMIEAVRKHPGGVLRINSIIRSDWQEQVLVFA